MATGLRHLTTGREAYLRAVDGAKSDRDRQAAAERALRFSEGADFSGLGVDRKQFQEAIVAQAAGRAKDAIADLVDKSLDDKKLAAGLMKPSTGPKPKAASDALAKFGESAAERIQRISESFDEQPRLIDRAAQATRALDDVMADLEKRKPAGYADLIEQAKVAKGVVQDGLVRPYNDFLDRQNEQLVVGDLIIAGRNVEADAVRDILSLQRTMGPLDEARRQVIIDGALALEDQARAMDKLQARMQPYLAASASMKSNIRDAIGGLRTEGVGAVGGLFKGMRQTFDNLMADVLTEKLFGDIFRSLDEEIRAANGIKTSSEIVNDALALLAKETTSAAGAMAQAVATINGTPAAANDNGAVGGAIGAGGNAPADGAEIVVTASKAMMKPAEFMSKGMSRLLETVLPEKLAKSVGKEMGDAMTGAAYGQTAGALVFGHKNDALGSSIGGAIGGKMGEKFLSKGLGEIAKGLGDFAGPIGSIIGGLVGGAIGGLMKKTKFASSTLMFDNATGMLGAGEATGNNAGAKGVANQLGGALVDSINDIALQLGGTITNAGSTSIGKRNDRYIVDVLGRGATKGPSTYGFDDQSEAMAFAILDAINDGVISGLRAGTQKLLRGGINYFAGDGGSADLEGALQKAMDFESVFKSLKAYDDPVGSALDELDQKFKKLQSTFKEAGASTEEYAALERLYGIERADAVREAGEKVTATLKGLLDDLTVNNDARSLRTRQGEAKATYDDLAAKVRGGDKSAYDDFAEAARTLLDIQREISGSGEGYFSLLDQVTELTRTRIATETNVADISAGRDSIFATETMAPVVSATESQTAMINAVSRENTAGIVAELQVTNATLLQLVRRQGGAVTGASDAGQLLGRAGNF